MKLCSAAGCGERATRFGRFCHTHRSRKRRHGDAEQRPVTKAELAPFLKLARARIEKNAGNALWSECEEGWRALAAHASAILAAERRGVPGNRAERAAAREVARLAENVEPMTLMEAAFAMFILAGTNGVRRFPTDAGFDAQLVRRLRGLTEANAGVWYDHRTGKTKRAYREVTPRTTALLAQWLRQTFAAVGLHLAALERRDWEAKQARAVRLVEAMEGLQ